MKTVLKHILIYSLFSFSLFSCSDTEKSEMSYKLNGLEGLELFPPQNYLIATLDTEERIDVYYEQGDKSFPLQKGEIFLIDEMMNVLRGLETVYQLPVITELGVGFILSNTKTKTKTKIKILEKSNSFQSLEKFLREVWEYKKTSNQITQNFVYDKYCKGLTSPLEAFKNNNIAFTYSTARVSLNIKPEHLFDFLDYLKQHPKEYIKQFKIVRYSKLNERINERKDNVIIYVDYLHNAELLAKEIKENVSSDFFNDAVPYFLKKVSRGIAIGEEPLSQNEGESFGSLRCSNISLSLSFSEDYPTFLSKVRIYMAASGVDFFKPHRNKGLGLGLPAGTQETTL